MKLREKVNPMSRKCSGFNFAAPPPGTLDGRWTWRRDTCVFDEYNHSHLTFLSTDLSAFDEADSRRRTSVLFLPSFRARDANHYLAYNARERQYIESQSSFLNKARRTDYIVICIYIHGITFCVWTRAVC